jgi:PfaB family protein
VGQEPIAIVGRGCVVPDACDPDTFWENVAAGRCSLSSAEDGGCVRNFEESFDARGFTVSADEIMALDPLYRWVLHAARQALREAGRESVPLPGAGLVLGNLSYPSAGLARFAEQIWRDGRPSEGTDPRDRFSSGLPAHFAARALGLGAGGFALDAACASSLYAIKIACDRLRDGATDLMVAGAVSCPDRLLIRTGFRALSAASPTGRSRPFHRGADGLVPGEGAALVALMRLDDAIRGGAAILGVIRAIGLSNDGRGGGLLSPAQEGQERAMRLAYAEAGVAPETVSLVECHATGTPVGDAVEARSTARIFAASTDLPVGSVKSNIGHLLAASGGAGLLKLLGAMRAGLRPASLSADDPIEALDGTPLRLLADPEDWPGPRRAAISAFGFGGANAHLIVDAWESQTVSRAVRPVPRPREPIAIIAIGAKVADGADANDFRQAVMLGERHPGPRTTIDVTLPGLRFPPRDLEDAHAQHILLLEAAREATNGIDLPRERTIVIVGMGVDPEVARHPVLQRAGSGPDLAPLTGAAVLGTMPNLVANRVNVQQDLAGPGYTVSAEEASGLVALELAGRALRMGEADAAIVGAVDLSCEPVHQAAVRALGRDRPPGDAAVVLVLERLADARRAGHRVIALVDETPPDGTRPDGPEPELVVGDAEPPGGAGSGGAGRFDPAELFGVAHAAHGLVAVAVAATALRHQVIPRPGGLAVPVSDGLAALVVVEPLGAPRATVRLRPGGPAEPWAAGPAPTLRVYSGADRAAVLEALAAGMEATAGPARLAIVAEGREALAARAEAARRWLADGGTQPDGVAYRDAPLGGEVAFVFPSGSAAYQGMGTELRLAFPAVAATIDVSHAPWQSRGGEAAAPLPSGGLGMFDRISGTAALGSFHAEISRRLLGIQPDAAIGYSSGESAALVALGAWTDPIALHRDFRASDLFAKDLGGELRAVRAVWRRLGLPGQRWAGYLVTAPAEEARAALVGEATVHLTAITAPDACVISGEETACEAVVHRLGAPAIRVDYGVAAHAPELAEVQEKYRRLHLRPTRDVPGVRFYSGATGQSYRASADRVADALLAQALGTVDFVQVIESAWADGIRVFIEHGPQGQTIGWIRRILGEREHLAVALDAPGGRAVRQLCHAVAELIAAGVPVDTAAFFDRLAEASGRSEVSANTVRLPAHPPELRLPRGESPAAVMPRAPRLPAVLDMVSPAGPSPAPAQYPSAQGALAQGASAQSPAAQSPAAQSPAAQSAPALTRVVSDQFQRVTAVHRDFLAQQAEAHARFLHVRQRGIAALARMASGAAPSAPGPPPVVVPPVPVPPVPESAGPVPAMPGPPISGPPAAHSVPHGPTFDRSQLERLADGRISELLGPRFAALDALPRPTRLPTPPMLLVDRVTGIDAIAASMGTGTIWTETDVTADGWYLDATGRLPAGLMVEAGQADLLLISWLGIDLLGPGDRVYRLLGCELTYHGSPAAAGETLRYEIHIDRHAEHGGVRLFFFHYDCHVGGELRMTVRNGQAGFFTDDELASTEGVQWDPAQVSPGDGPLDPPVAALSGRRFGHDALRAFAEGRPADCFGPGWRAARAHVRSPRIGSGRMLLLGAVTDVDPAGGPWRRGYLRAETAVSADDWFFAGHFKNDPCMPGTLMFEGGLQAMAFYLAALGFTIDRDGWRFEPVPGEPCLLRCRGQVSPASSQIVYEVFVSELSSDPCPTLYADVLGTVDGVKAFHARRAGLRLVPGWPLEDTAGQDMAGQDMAGQAAAGDGRAVLAGGVRQDHAALLACAWGRPTRAIGPDYARFDGYRRAPRLPGPPYHFMTRIVALDGRLGGMGAGSAVTAEYDVAASAWYFESSGALTMPFAVLMEVTLQPCGWLAMYVGSVLDSDADLLFRNLDGTGTVLREVRPGTQPPFTQPPSTQPPSTQPLGVQALRTHVELREISRFDDVIIESFTARCTIVGGPADGEAVFETETTFGFFPKAAFAQQPGLPPSDAERALLVRPCERVVDLAAQPPEYCAGPARLAGPMLIMIDRVTGYWPGGGRAGLGWLRAEKDIDPGEWFFKAHFFQDPVQPGSLGIQAMCHLLQWYLIERGPAASLPSPRFEPIMTGHPVTWKYRGQVVPADRCVIVELEITATGEDERGRYAIADGWLWVDGRRIYHVRDLGMRLVPGAAA